MYQKQCHDCIATDMYLVTVEHTVEVVCPACVEWTIQAQPRLTQILENNMKCFSVKLQRIHRKTNASAMLKQVCFYSLPILQ